jgi:phosphatidylglycerophosphate synthase
MTQPIPLVIDARPRGRSGPLAVEAVLGRPVLAQLLDAAGAAGRRDVTIHARPDEFGLLGELLPPGGPIACRFAPGPPPAGAAILRADRLYEPSRLRQALHRGRDPETAVLWRLDTPAALAVAGDELIRRRTYQPLGRFWALEPARWLARRLAPTRFRPNAVTALAGTLMLLAAGLVAFGPTSPAARGLAAFALALALVLDTADGHLARLQGTASAFGRWLDANLDELADVALHAAISWSLSADGTRPGWLLLGMLYVSGKYLFHFGATTWTGQRSEAMASEPIDECTGLVRKLAHWAGHADIRWHLWIVLAALGRLDIELVAYSAYFPLRAAAGAWRKGVAHG